MAATLKITDGTTEVSLISGYDGFYLNSWRPAITPIKGRGTWQNSPLSEGRRLVARQYGNAIETFDLKIAAASQDSAATLTQELRRLLEKATNYWVTNWQKEPVWIEAQATNETNARYALIHSWATPTDENPYAQPFLQPDCAAAMDNWPLIIERGHWQSTEPGTGDCVELTGLQLCPANLEFDDSGDLYLNCGSQAALDDLHAGTHTIDGWIRPDDYGENYFGFQATKGGANAGWRFFVGDDPGIPLVKGLCWIGYSSGINGQAYSGRDEFVPDGRWHYVALCFNRGAARTPELWIDDGLGTVSEVATYTAQVAMTGVATTDAATDLHIGEYFGGGIGWMRIRNNILYVPGNTYDTPTRCYPPVSDGNTIAIWGMYEGIGDVVDNFEGTAALDGTVVGATWNRDCGDDCMFGRGSTYEDVRRVYVPEENDDDVFVRDSTGSIWNTTYLQFGHDGTGAVDTGIRFRDVTIPPEARITRAFVRFTAAENDAGTTVNVEIYGEDEGNPLPFSTYADFAGRTETNAFTTWNAVGAWVQGTTYDTPDISLVISEITDRNDWASGQNLVLFFNDNSSSSAARRRPASYENAPYHEAELHIEYRLEVDEATCENEVFIANKQNRAQLTHIYYNDGAAWSGNLIGSVLPFRLLPDVPAVGDAVYFGIDTTTFDSGPFCSLVFDLSTAQTDLTTVNWEYYQGAPTNAWSALTVQDNTNADGAMTGDAFDTTGVKSVHWDQPLDAVNGDWVPNDPGMGVTGYWVRADVGVIGAGPLPPYQQNRDIYTITWGHVNVDDLQVAGDIAARAQWNYYVRSDDDGTSLMYSERTVAGLRDLARGEDFTAYLNAADEQNPTGLTVGDDGAETSFADYIRSPTGRVAYFTSAGLVTIGPQLNYTFDSDLAPQYYGEFHAFMRGYRTAGDGTARLSVSIDTTATTIMTTDTINISSGDGDRSTIWDMGRIVLPPGYDLYDEDDVLKNMILSLELGCPVGGMTLRVYDLILIPVDEWAGDFIGIAKNGWDATTDEWDYLDIDSVRYPKRDIRSLLRAEDDDHILLSYRPITNSPAILQANTDQRLWMLNMYEPSLSAWKGLPYVAGNIQAWKTQRYLSLRGER